MIIVEGGDNVGKSRLIEQLIHLDPRLRLIHRDRYKPDAGETIGTTHIRALLPPDGDWVRHGHSLADRFFASEEIYGELFRGGSRFTSTERLTIKLLLANYTAIVVWCNPPAAAVDATWKQRDQLYRDGMCIWQAYRDRLRRIFDGFAVIRYDWTAPSAAADRECIIRMHDCTPTLQLDRLSRIIGDMTL